jgi:hypothetical protein
MVPEILLLPSQTTEVHLVKTTDGSKPQWATKVELGWLKTRLLVRWECEDPDIWCSMRERDMPLYEEEVVEVFIAPGEGDPHHYFEFEVNPDGTLWDGEILSPNLSREGMVSREEWNSQTLDWSAWRDDRYGRWGGEMSIPLDELAPEGIPPVWRLNVYRIERPQAGKAEFSAWAPTMKTPADFHVPRMFGRLRLAGL